MNDVELAFETAVLVAPGVLVGGLGGAVVLPGPTEAVSSGQWPTVCAVEEWLDEHPQVRRAVWVDPDVVEHLEAVSAVMLRREQSGVELLVVAPQCLGRLSPILESSVRSFLSGAA